MNYQIPALIAVFAILFLGIFAIGGYIETKNPGLFVLANKTTVKPIDNNITTKLTTNLNTNLNANLIKTQINKDLIRFEDLDKNKICYDNDENNIFVKGTTIGLDAYGKTTISTSDHCSLTNYGSETKTGFYVVEEMCDSENKAHAYYIKCPENMVCNDGACVSDENQIYIGDFYSHKITTKQFGSGVVSLYDYCPKDYYLYNQSCKIKHVNENNYISKIEPGYIDSFLESTRITDEGNYLLKEEYSTGVRCEAYEDNNSYSAQLELEIFCKKI